MGLDVHFYNRKKIKPEQKVDGLDILKEVSLLSDNIDLLKALEKLKSYTVLSGESFVECLVRAINHFVDSESNFYEDMYNEVAYFRNFWWILGFFDYSDSDYAEDKLVTIEQLEEAKSISEQIIKDVIKHFIGKGFEIESSPLDYNGHTSRIGGNKSYFLTFKNGLFTEELEDEANDICSGLLGCNDSNLFYKVCEMYVQFKNILNNTDWDNECIVLNSDW